MDRQLIDKLRIPQKEAFAKMREYITAFKKELTSKSALVQMPTGSGKTGVAACVSHYITDVSNVLIVSPRLALRSQLVREITGGFFKEIGYQALALKKVVEADDDQPFPLPDKNKIIISTIQKLQALRRNNTKGFKALLSKINLIIFDEGHYEPSPTWSKTIREFKCPKIIFTATPFRNDLKSFDIDINFIYSYSFNDSISSGIVREVEIIKKNRISNPNDFVEDVLREFKRLKQKLIGGDSKLIIRCDDSSSILRIARVLEQKNESFIAIHETFGDRSRHKWKHKNVPDPNEISEEIWIHQYKLLEGIDEPRFRVLATYDEFSNARQLIQQVGRIIRNPGKKIGEKAYFIDHTGGEQEKRWKEYLEYDKQVKDRPSKSMAEIVEEMLEQLPEKEYINGRFRKRFNISENLDPLVNQIKIPLKVNFLEIQEEFSEQNLCEFLEARFENNDFRFKRYELIEYDAFLYLYIQLTHSEILTERYFMNISLKVMLFKKISDELLAFYDSLNYLPINNDELKIGKALEPKFLKKLISESDDSRLVSVSLKNSNLGNRSIRTHSYSAASISQITPFLDDHAQIIAGITGYSFEGKGRLSGNPILKRRYIGINKGRIAEGSMHFELRLYFTWLTEINKLLDDSKRKQLNTFNRYSREKENVSKTNPLHILLDFSEIEHLRFRDLGNNERDVVFEDLSCEISGSGSGSKGVFIIRENGISQHCTIEYDEKRKKYLLESDSLSQNYFTENKIDLIGYLNETQSFRVIPEQKDCIYIDGNFYQPSIRVGKKFDEETFHVGHILHTDPFLKSNGNEKGNQCLTNGRGWEKDSLFSFIHNLGKKTSFNSLFGIPDLLICDDLGTECADFILSDSDRVVFIHAKGLGNKISNYSASKLQDVCGQATKNIQYLSMFNNMIPKKIGVWDKPWKVKNIGQVKDRRLIGKGSPKQIWETLQSRINNPLKEKEVWLVLGRLLSKSLLIEHLSKTNPSHEAVQAAILLHGTMTNVSSIGAKMRVFCHP